MNYKKFTLDELEARQDGVNAFLNMIESKYHISETWSERDQRMFDAALLNLEEIEIAINYIKDMPQRSDD